MIECDQIDLDTLNECIEDRWEYYAGINEKKPSDGNNSCVLCSLAFDRLEKGVELLYPCTYCIVYKDSGEAGCANTPYPDWDNSMAAWGMPDINTLNCAKDMVTYLENLRNKLKVRG